MLQFFLGCIYKGRFILREFLFHCVILVLSIYLHELETSLVAHGKESTCKSGAAGDVGSIPELGPFVKEKGTDFKDNHPEVQGAELERLVSRVTQDQKEATG